MNRFMMCAAAVTAAIMLSGCDPVSGGKLFDPLIKRMAGDETLALFDELERTLREDDVAGLEAMMADGFEPGFSERMVDHVPNDAPDARYFFQFNASTNWSTSGKSRSIQAQRIYRYQSGDHVLVAVFYAAGEDPLKLVQIGFHPLDGDGSAAAPEPASQAEPAYDPI